MPVVAGHLTNLGRNILRKEVIVSGCIASVIINYEKKILLSVCRIFSQDFGKSDLAFLIRKRSSGHVESSFHNHAEKCAPNMLVRVFF